jgi:hypothetical protein
MVNSEEFGRNQSSFFFLMGWDSVHLVLRPLFGLLYQPQRIDDEDDCGAIGRMKIGSRNRSTRRKPTPVSLFPPQIPHDQTRTWTRAAAVGSRRLTAWAMAWPFSRGLIEVTFRHFSRRAEETHKILSQISPCPSRDSNPAPPLLLRHIVTLSRYNPRSRCLLSVILHTENVTFNVPGIWSIREALSEHDWWLLTLA